MGGIFVSYRRQDSAGHAHALYDRLRPRFSNQVFMDVAGSIAPGVDFVEAIEEAIGTCRILLVIIGREWISGSGDGGRRRLDDPHDLVRVEVATALARNVVVIPVLVEGAHMPTASELPEDLARLVRRQAIELRDTHWDSDVDLLITALGRTLAKDTAPGAAHAVAAAPRPEAPPQRPPPLATELRHPPDRSRGFLPAPPRRERSERTPRSRGPLLTAGLAVIAASIGGYLWWSSTRVTVPSLVGQSFDSAHEQLRSVGLVTRRGRHDTQQKHGDRRRETYPS